MTLKFNLDPSLSRVVVTALLEFAIVSLGAVLVLLQEGNMPNEIQIVTIVVMASLGLLTSLQQFVKVEETEEKA